MTIKLEEYRKRNHMTQKQLGEMLFVDSSYISRIESGDKPVTPSMYQAGFSNVEDAHLLNDMAYDFTQGFTTPTASNRVYDDHRMAIAHRMKREMCELKEAMAEHCLDKHPAYLNPDEKEEVSRIASEAQDVLFEVQSFVMRLVNVYDFITPQSMKENRDARLKMERRI